MTAAPVINSDQTASVLMVDGAVVRCKTLRRGIDDKLFFTGIDQEVRLSTSPLDLIPVEVHAEGTRYEFSALVSRPR